MGILSRRSALRSGGRRPLTAPSPPSGPPPARSRAAAVVLLLAVAAVLAGQAVTVTWGLSHGQAWVDLAAERADGLRSDHLVVLLAGATLSTLGGWLVAGAVLPRRRTHVSDARVEESTSSLWWEPRALALLAHRHADRQPGVLEVRSIRTTRRRLVLEVGTLGSDAPDLARLRDEVSASLPAVPTRTTLRVARPRREGEP